VLCTEEPDYPLDLFPDAMYAMSCLPVQAVVLLVGAAIGASNTRIREGRWRQAAHAMWTVALLATTLAAIVMPSSGV
jgi:hypothetical protein